MPTQERDITLFLVTTTVIILLLAILILTVINFYQKRQLIYQEKFNALKSDYEKTLMSAQLEIQENTFQRISREIHDNINLSLTLAKLHLNTLSWNESEKAYSQVNTTIGLLTESIANLSNISKGLNADVISSYGLVKAVENEISRIADADLFDIKLSIEGEPVHLNNQKELIVFRIIQEAFNNILKHSHAQETIIALSYLKDHIKIHIEDNGNGFNLKDQLNACGKAGLKNMQNRAEMLQGVMEINTWPGKGTILTFKIPF